MLTSGYSGTPLLKKLGIQPEMKLVLVNEPGDYFLMLGKNLRSQLITGGTPDLVHIFAVEREELEKEFAAVLKMAAPTTVIWISWYKKTSRMKTNITEDIIRLIVLPTGWVDIKVCAINDLWSGLKIVKRISLR